MWNDIKFLFKVGVIFYVLGRWAVSSQKRYKKNRDKITGRIWW